MHSTVNPLTPMSPEFETYFAAFPQQTQDMLREMYDVVKAVLPEAQEKISYGMPCFYQKQNVVYFAAFKNHIGFYPTSSGVKAFENELVGLKFSKGAIQFPLDKAIPEKLIQKIVLYRLEEIETKLKKK
jgi:uncharacterized protein YdhG (YjbR/CyaY superfamily)